MRRDHGGGIDAARAQHGGARQDWLDLSTGINPQPYPLGEIPQAAWTALPDHGAATALIDAARVIWQVPPGAEVLAAPGASALIARLPGLRAPGRVHIPGPTYNEHAASFRAQGWQVVETQATPGAAPDARVIVHPDNPTGRLYGAGDLDAPLTVIDESFCDVMPDRSLVAHAARPGVLVLKSFGKFWGLAGLRLGFVIGSGDLLARLSDALGPWPVSGPALDVAARALHDVDWAERTRARLHADAARLDTLMTGAGAAVAGGCPLFRLYHVDSAAAWQARLARARILIRVFPHSHSLIRLGLPGSDQDWLRLGAAL